MQARISALISLTTLLGFVNAAPMQERGPIRSVRDIATPDYAAGDQKRSEADADYLAYGEKRDVNVPDYLAYGEKRSEADADYLAYGEKRDVNVPDYVAYGEKA